MIRRPRAFQVRLSAIDPGLIRLLAAERAALALISIWLVLRTALIILYGKVQPILPLFGMVSGVVLLLFIIDLKPKARKISLWLATLPYAGALMLASTLAGYAWLSYLILLILFFFAYFLRRYGTRTGELALVSTVGYYLGFLLHPGASVFPFLVVCVLFSALMVTLWEFVIIPYDPVKFLQRSVRAFYHNVSAGVTAVRQVLDAGEISKDGVRRLQRAAKNVNQNRNVIEGLFAAAVSPSLWSQDRLNQLQEEMFKSERGLDMLVGATGSLSGQMHDVPADVLGILRQGLAVLEDQVLGAAAGQEQERLHALGDQLEKSVQASLEEKSEGEWVFSLLRMGIATRQLAQSIANIQGFETGQVSRALETQASKPGKTPQQPSIQKPFKRNFHPTTILGLQAALAGGLAMLAAALLKMDSPALVFWTAFVVIAGSTGESLRRIIMRVVSVIAGTAVGVALAVLLPDNLILTVLCVTFCLFLTVYILTVSYAWMLFWLNIALLLIITSIGGSALQLLVARPVSTLVGAAMAALVVTFVLPIRVQNRFKAALVEFMKAVDEYIQTYTAIMLATTSDDNLGGVAIKIDASYKKLELSLASVVYEYNPFSRSWSGLASQETSLAVLKGYVTNLREDVGEEPGSITDAGRADLVYSMQARIHANVENLVLALVEVQKEQEQAPGNAPRQAAPEISLENIVALEGGPMEAVRDRALFHLVRINDSILQIAEGIGALGVSRAQ